VRRSIVTCISGGDCVVACYLHEPESITMQNVDLIVRAADAPLLARPYYGDGEPSPIVAALAQVPEFLTVAMPFVGTVLGDSAICERWKEIVIVRASAVRGCRYCVEAHTVVAWEAGLTPDEVRALRNEGPFPASFDDRERAIAAFATALCDAPADAVAHLRPYFGDHEIVELTTVGAATIMLNTFATALGLPTSAATRDRLAAEGIAA